MNIKLNIVSAAILAAVSTTGVAGNPVPFEPPTVADIYAWGPSSPLVASTDMSDAERSAYANYEALMQIAEARIHASSCSDSVGTFPVTAYSDGAQGMYGPYTNFATVLSPGGVGSLKVAAWISPEKVGFGQQINVKQVDGGSLKGKAVSGYDAYVAYNSVNNMMDSNMSVSVASINGKLDKYYGKVIKDFYMGDKNGGPSYDPYNIYDWGLQSLDKLGYPVNKWWQRSKSHRDDGTIGRTVFVKDRLVGATSCRIILDTTGFNNQDYFSQSGNLIIQSGVNPIADVPQFHEYPF
jgi:hypothetical protein